MMRGMRGDLVEKREMTGRVELGGLDKENGFY